MRSPFILIGRTYDRFSAVLEAKGCSVANLELIRTIPVEPVPDVFENIGSYDGVFVTSSAAAEVVARQHDRQRFNGSVYALGQRAGRMLRDAGLDVVLRESANTAEEFIGAFGRNEFGGKTFLFVRGDRSLRTIPELLEGVARIDEVIVYRTLDVVPDPDVIKSLQVTLNTAQVDWICLFSPSGVENLLNVVGFDLIRPVPVAVIGETTATAARDAGLDVRFVSAKATAEYFADSFVEYLKTS